MSRNAVFGIVMAVIVIAVLELQSWALAHVAMRMGSLRFYPSDLFARLSDEELAAAAPKGPLGWPADDAPRAAPSDGRVVCGTAFGDSMTFGSEVRDDEAWVHLLSVQLGCTVANYAVPAYGADQALLRYERVPAEGRFVMLGLFREMIRRSVAASWTFYAPLHPPEVYFVKPFFTLDGEGLRLHAIPGPFTREALAAHHVDDHYLRRVATPLAFPYTAAAVRALYIRLARTDEYRGNLDRYFDPAHPSGSGLLIRRLVERFAQVAHSRGARLIVVLVPPPEQLAGDTVWVTAFADDLRRNADLCLIDPKPYLRQQARPFGGKAPTAPKGHYTALGNRWMADAVAAGLRACRLAP